jgi:hypothetical protein
MLALGVRHDTKAPAAFDRCCGCPAVRRLQHDGAARDRQSIGTEHVATDADLGRPRLHVGTRDVGRCRQRQANGDAQERSGGRREYGAHARILA